MKFLWIFIVAVTVLLVSAFPSFGAVSYDCIDLGLDVHPLAINNNGQIAGVATFSDGESHAFSWQNNEIKDLGLGCYAYGINDSGVVVGTSNRKAILWDGNQTLSLDNSTDGSSRAIAVNGPGHVVTVSAQDVNFHYYLWRDNGFTRLGDLRASAMNDLDQVVGDVHTPNGRSAAIWSNGTVEQLNLHDYGFEDSWASAINNSGQVAGGGYVGNECHSFIWKDGVVQDIGVLPDHEDMIACDVNDRGQVIGIARHWWSEEKASESVFLWDNGILTALGALSGSSTTVSINDAGQIAFTGIGQNDWSHGFLLSPVPEPSSLVSLLAGLGGVGSLLRYTNRRNRANSDCHHGQRKTHRR